MTISMLGATIVVLLASIAVPAGAQTDSVTVAAGARYEANSVQKFVLGSRYRELWTAPIRVPVLEPDTFAGGLELLQEGGGNQTLSLRFGSSDGREWVFRSVDKDQSGGLHEDLRETWIDDIVQDQISSKHPGAAVAVAPLMEAAGVLHAVPTLAVMADHPVLGEFREQFAGMLGMIEERPTEVEDNRLRFGAYERLIGTERLLERVEESAEDRVDSRVFLKARFMDLLVGDWDRHSDQWRWAQDDRNGRRFWLPIPRDRDNALFYTDGVVGALGGAVRPFVVQYGDEYDAVYGLTYNAQHLDRQFLTELPLAVWDSVATDLQGRLSDDVIADAVRQMPEEYFAVSGPELERTLRARRDALPVAAREFYAQVAREAEIYATDEDEDAEVERLPDGSVRVTLQAESGGESPYYERVFHPSETREIRLDLRGGDDRAMVTGSGEDGLLVRVMGGGADDHLEDAAEPGSGRTVLYDDREDDDVLVPGPNTVVDRSAFEPPPADTLTRNNSPAQRNWGSDATWFAPEADWRSEVGPVIGGGPQAVRYGFRRYPFATRAGIELLYAPLHGRFEVAAEAERVRTGSDGQTRVRALASQIDLTRFHGYGNETPDGPDPHSKRVWATRYALAAEWVEHFGRGTRAGVGPIVTYLDPEAVAGSPATAAGIAGDSSFALAGLQGAASFDLRDSAGFTRRGAAVDLGAEWYPLVTGDAPGAFIRSNVIATGYLPLPLPLETILALRGGGEVLWGDAPLQYAAFLGGGSSLRGYRTDRFAGDAAIFGSAELRSTLGRINLLLARGDFGTIALADAGRVFVEGEDSDTWHTGYGGGLWFGPVDMAFTAHILAVAGERTKVRVGLGMPF